MYKVITIHSGPNGWSVRAGHERRHYSRREIDEAKDACRVAGEYARDTGAQVVEVFRWRDCFIALIN